MSTSDQPGPPDRHREPGEPERRDPQARDPHARPPQPVSPEPAGRLGAFLKACRSRVSPHDAGITPYGDRRRVSGLRREELAMLAGVSPSYYARLEQGQSRNASPQVLDAIASALGLAPDEREHLHTLAAAAGHTRALRAPAVEHPDPALLELLGAIPDVPALVMGRRSDVLAWNPMGHALLAGHLDPARATVPGRRPNMAEIVFLDPECRALYTDWDRKARAVVGNLRLVAGAHPDDPALASLIGRLTMASPAFHALWADQRVQACATAEYELRHPQVGRLTVTQQTLRSLQQPDQTLVTHTAAAGSPSAAALTMLAHLTRDRDMPRYRGSADTADTAEAAEVTEGTEAADPGGLRRAPRS